LLPLAGRIEAVESLLFSSESFGIRIIDDFGYYDIVISMRTMIFLMLASGGLLLQPAIRAAAPEVLEQRAESFTITLQGSVAEVTPLFGPVREVEWAPSWRPRFLHPAQGGQCEGAVFTNTSSNGTERLWLLTAYDLKEGRVEYVFITAGFTASEIKIRVVPDGDGQSKATITYRHSALAREGNAEVEKLNPHWAEQQRAHWETAINAVLTKRGPHD
jgi:hypothetical protein